MVDTRIIPSLADDNPIPEEWAADQRRAPDVARELPLFLDQEETKAPDLSRSGGPRRCNICSKYLSVTEAESDHAQMARVVRKNNSYGGAKEGELVYVEVRDLGGSAGEATIDLLEYRRAVEASRRPVEKQEPALLAMVKATFENVARQTRAQIDNAKEKIDIEARRQLENAMQVMQRAGVLPMAAAGAAPASDLEQPSQPFAPVSDAVEQRAREVEAGNDRLRAAIAERRKLIADAAELGIKA